MNPLEWLIVCARENIVSLGTLASTYNAVPLARSSSASELQHPVTAHSCPTQLLIN